MDNWTSRSRVLAACATAALAGGIGMFGYLPVMPMVLLFAVALSLVDKARQAVIVAFCYYMAATYDLPIIAYDHTGGNLAAAIFAAPLANLLLALPYALVPRFRVIGFVVALVLTTVPPLGHIGWTNPLTTAGLIFPGTGFFGLGLCLVLLLVIYLRPLVAFVAPVAVVVWLLIPPAIAGSSDWTPLHTRLGSLIEAGWNIEKDFLSHKALFPVIRKSAASHVVLPEGAMGIWSDTNERRWRRRLDFTDKVVLGGGETKIEDGQFYNSLILIDSDMAEPVYHSRMPVPFFMTRQQQGYFKGSDDDGVFEYRGRVYGGLICYEASLTWTVLQTHWHRPEAVFVAANLWSARRSQMRGMVETVSAAWGILFATPYHVSYNE